MRSLWLEEALAVYREARQGHADDPRSGEVLLREARRDFDYVLVDTPPAVMLPDCRLIARWVDGFLVVVAAHTTPRHLVAEALDQFDPGKVLGVVFNADDKPTSCYGYYGYGR